MPRFAVVLALLAAACGGDDPATPDGAPPPDDAASPDAAPPDATPGPDANLTMPHTLEESGLYSDFATETLADGVVAYAPQFELWSDGASKKRYLYLPPDTQIDTSDMDFWRFPQGTKLWKEFTAPGGTRVETRLLLKTGPSDSDWYMMAYAWNEDQTEAVEAPFGANDVLGTNHDIPRQSQCTKCHERMPDRVLGPSAIQLAHDGPGLTLQQLIDDGLLTDPPASIPVVPGDDTERAALGYLHANCGNCHNDFSDVSDAVNMRLWLTVGHLATVQDTPTYTTSVGVPNQLVVDGVTAIIDPGSPATSAVHVRMNTRATIGMPPLGTEVIHDDGLAIVDAWIDVVTAP